MASKEQRKFQKKKERGRRVRKQILAEREGRMAEGRLYKKVARIAALKKEMGSANMWTDEVFLGMDDQTLARLERNAKILKALEEEHLKETEQKRSLNERLEDEGHWTLEDKMRHLHERLAAEQQKLYGEAPPEVLKENSESS